MTGKDRPQMFFDGHNDVLLRLLSHAEPERDFLSGDGEGQLDLPRMKAGGFAGGLFAIYIPSDLEPPAEDPMLQPEYDIPLPPPIPAKDAAPLATRMAATLLRIEQASKGGVRICRSAGDIRAAMKDNVLAAVMHMEGAEAIDADFAMLDMLYAAGLRSLGPVWSRPNIFGHGVPFRFPSSPDTGPGLTEKGRELVRICNNRRVAIDLSHLNEQGFWDVAAVSDAPLIASHSNAHTICASSRNLTDRQLHAIRERRGIVGVNFAVAFLRPDGQHKPDTALDIMLRHIDHLIQHAGIDSVGFGSDFDGATVPKDITDAAGLPNLADAMRKHGYDDETMRKLCFDNWINVLERTWGS